MMQYIAMTIREDDGDDIATYYADARDMLEDFKANPADPFEYVVLFASDDGANYTRVDEDDPVYAFTKVDR